MKKPLNRRRFLNIRDELNYLHDIVDYHLVNNTINCDEAIEKLERFEQLLSLTGKDDGSIMLKSHWAILYEARGLYSKAAEERKQEIAYIEELFRISGPVDPINMEFLLCELNKLLENYRELGDIDNASLTIDSINKWTSSHEFR
jgi:hypothetical protein